MIKKYPAGSAAAIVGFFIPIFVVMCIFNSPIHAGRIHRHREADISDARILPECIIQSCNP